MTISDMQPGEKALIKNISGKGHFRNRLMERCPYIHKYLNQLSGLDFAHFRSP